MIDNAKRYNDDECSEIGDFLAYLYFVCDKKVLSDMTEVTFEGKKYKAPKRYDEWLTALYGDYMTLPPVEEQVSHHRCQKEIFLKMNLNYYHILKHRYQFTINL